MVNTESYGVKKDSADSAGRWEKGRDDERWLRRGEMIEEWREKRQSGEEKEVEEKI